MIMKNKRYVKREYESKAVQRGKLRELVGSGVVSFKGKMTLGRKVSQHPEGLRLMIDVTAFLKGERIYIDHLFIKNKECYDIYSGKCIDFKAEVVTYGLENKVGLDKVFIKKYIKKAKV
jgi:hypothetical protein